MEDVGVATTAHDHERGAMTVVEPDVGINGEVGGKVADQGVGVRPMEVWAVGRH